MKAWQFQEVGHPLFAGTMSAAAASCQTAGSTATTTLTAAGANALEDISGRAHLNGVPILVAPVSTPGNGDQRR